MIRITINVERLEILTKHDFCGKKRGVGLFSKGRGGACTQRTPLSSLGGTLLYMRLDTRVMTDAPPPKESRVASLSRLTLSMQNPGRRRRRKTVTHTILSKNISQNTKIEAPFPPPRRRGTTAQPPPSWVGMRLLMRLDTTIITHSPQLKVGSHPSFDTP